jgi:hypothetical protein
MAMTLARSKENQQKGWVTVFYNVGYQRRPWDSFPLLRAYRRYQHGVPRRLTGAHVCYNDPMLRPFVLTQKLFTFDSNLRSRMKDHYGSHEQCIFELQTYGIGINDPSQDHQLIMPDGSISLKGYQMWLHHRRAEEKITSHIPYEPKVGKEQVTIEPGRFDVLHGRGSKNSKHTGKLRLVHLCTMKLDAYNASNKYQKVNEQKTT